MAFESLSEKLSAAFKRLRSKGKLNEADIKTAMREVRLALLEADVNFLVVKDFVKKVVEEAKKKLADIEKKADDVYNSLANSVTILKAMEDAGKATDGKKGKKADKEGGNKPSKSTDEKPSDTSAKPAKGKDKTSRQERDEALMKKLQDNPNIK